MKSDLILAKGAAIEAGELILNYYKADYEIKDKGYHNPVTTADHAADLRASTPSVAAELVSEDRQETIQLLDHYSQKLSQSIFQNIKTYKERLNSYHKRHGLFMPRLIIQKMNEKLNHLNIRFRQVTLNYLQNKQVDIVMKSEKIKLLNPKLLLKRGFSIITDNNQQIILSPSQLNLDDLVNVQVANGKFIAKVIKKRGG
mgnify:CR=1 FL=1